MSVTLVSLPREIHAILASCLGEGSAGDLMRTLAGPAEDWVTAKDNYNYCTVTLCNGLVHSFRDQPAVVWLNGNRQWFKNGLQHRDGDQPAGVWQNGLDYFFEWYKNGERHREGGQPARLWASRTRANAHRFWYKNGNRVNKHSKS